MRKKKGFILLELIIAIPIIIALFISLYIIWSRLFVNKSLNSSRDEGIRAWACYLSNPQISVSKIQEEEQITSSLTIKEEHIENEYIYSVYYKNQLVNSYSEQELTRLLAKQHESATTYSDKRSTIYKGKR